MGKFDGMMLFSDLDGTLFDSNTRLPARNTDAIKYFTSEGGLFAVATGRSPKSLGQFAIDIGVNAPCVVLNGCGIYDYNKDCPVYEKFLEDAAVKAASEIAKRHAGVNTVVFFSDGSMAASNGVDTLPPCFDASHVPGHKAQPREVADRPWFKVVFVSDLKTLGEIEKECTAAELKDTAMTYAGDDMLELLPGNTSKGGGMIKAAELMGVPIERVCAIGDHYNDREMIEAAGISAVAGQAPEDLKAIADYVACSCDGGAVGWFIEKLGAAE